MPNNHFCSTYMIAYHHLKNQHSLKACGKTKLWPTWGKKTANKWPQKCDGGPYNGADSVHWPFIYIYIKELPIYKKESGCIPQLLVKNCQTAGSILPVDETVQPNHVCSSWISFFIGVLVKYFDGWATVILPVDETVQPNHVFALRLQQQQ